jgi:pimeloyl-ACP methyl ester carboxylesterase
MRSKAVVTLGLVLVFGACSGPSAEAPFHTAVAPAPSPGSFFIYPERIPLVDGGFANVERGMYFAPVNRANPASGVLGVEVYRFRASPKADPETPPIFFLHGGPSFPGLERSLEELGTFEERWLPLTDVSDVVVVGQRGIGSSKPTTTIDATIPNQPADEAFDAEVAKEEFQAVLRAERAIWEESGLDLAGFTVLDAAEDVNEVRRALGYDKITVWGGSFGSHWSMALMRKHPEIIERVILRGMEGPDHTYDDPGHLWNVYRRVAEEAEASPELQGRIPEGGLVAAFEEVLRRARENPFEVQITDPADGTRHQVLFDGTAVQRLARGYSNGLPGWPADVIELWEGDFNRAATELYARSVSTARDFRTASYFQLDCGSGITPERLAEQLAEPANQVLFGMNWGYIAGCPVWDSDLGNDFRQNFETEIPAVIAHGTWDTSTPLENALELLPFFKNSRFIPVVRGPHGAIQAAMGASEEFRTGILHFAATGDWSRLPDTVWMPEVEFRVPGSG